MATPITGIALNCDFTGYMKLIVFCPNVGDISGTITRNLVNVGTHNTGNIFRYDTFIGAYVKWFHVSDGSGWAGIGGSLATPEIDNGTITLSLNSNPTETYTVNYQYKSYGYLAGGLTPQGIGATYQPCENGMSKVYINSEAKPNDHYNLAKVQAQTAQIISPTAGAILAPTFIVPTGYQNNTNDANWVSSHPFFLGDVGNTKDSIWDLGMVSSSQPITVRVTGWGTDGTDGYATGDFIEETIQVFCSLTGTDGLGSSTIPTGVSNYTIPEPTSGTGCVPTGLTVLSIPSGSTIQVGGTTYAINSTIPIAALTLVGSDYTGVEEHTTSGTATGTNSGATFAWESACGQSNQVTVQRTISGSCTPVGGGVINGNALVVNGVTENYTISGLTGDAPFTYTWSVTNGVVVGGQGTVTAQIQMSADGTVGCLVTNCSGLNSVNLTKAVTLITADAVDDPQGVKTLNVAYSVDVATNDTPCNGGAITTYIISAGSESNVVINSVVGSVFDYTPTGTPFSFQYEIQCNGTTVDGATVSGTAGLACTPVGSGTIVGNTNVTVNVNETYIVSGLVGTAPFTYNWSGATIVSGQGTDTVVITPTTNPTTLTCLITNCSGTGTINLTKPLNVKMGCTPTVYCKSNCWTIVSTTGTLSGVTEANRVISTTPTSITFNAEVGTHDYTFILTDTNSIQHQVTYKNIIC